MKTEDEIRAAEREQSGGKRNSVVADPPPTIRAIPDAFANGVQCDT